MHLYTPNKGLKVNQGSKKVHLFIIKLIIFYIQHLMEDTVCLCSTNLLCGFEMTEHQC